MMSFVTALLSFLAFVLLFFNLLDPVNNNVEIPAVVLLAKSETSSPTKSAAAEEGATDCTKLLQLFRNDQIEAAKTTTFSKVEDGKEVTKEKNYKRAFITTTVTPKPFYVSTHDEIIDNVRAGTFKYHQYYEHELSKRVMEVFDEKAKNQQESIMLDVGANIGWFSLLAKAHGATKVYSFEPNVRNLIRICESFHLNGWLAEDSTTTSTSIEQQEKTMFLIPKGASNHTGTLKFYEHAGSNPGENSFAALEGGGKVIGELDVVTLDSFADEHGWFESKPNIAFFKLDVEQYELEVLKGAQKLLKSHLIEKIAMELKSKQLEDHVNAVVEILVTAGYELYMHGAWMGPNTPVMKNYDKWEDLAKDLNANVYSENVLFRLKK